MYLLAAIAGVLLSRQSLEAGGRESRVKSDSSGSRENKRVVAVVVVVVVVRGGIQRAKHDVGPTGGFSTWQREQGSSKATRDRAGRCSVDRRLSLLVKMARGLGRETRRDETDWAAVVK